MVFWEDVYKLGGLSVRRFVGLSVYSNFVLVSSAYGLGCRFVRSSGVEISGCHIDPRFPSGAEGQFRLWRGKVCRFVGSSVRRFGSSSVRRFSSSAIRRTDCTLLTEYCQRFLPRSNVNKSTKCLHRCYSNMKRVSGIGGIFFKSKDPEKLKSWYAKHLGIESGEYGGGFHWRESDNPEKEGFTAWSIFDGETTYFEPSKREYMFNYRVENLEKLLGLLKEEGVEVLPQVETYSYGKFGWIIDPEGRKIELWEPGEPL